MTYEPQFEDRVTSPHLVGEWRVLKVKPGGRTEVCQDGHMLRVPTKTLRPVNPPGAPEPEVGVAVRAFGSPWWREDRRGLMQTIVGEWINPWGHRKQWAELATAEDLSLVIAINDVVDWCEERGYHAMAGYLGAQFGATT